MTSSSVPEVLDRVAVVAAKFAAERRDRQAAVALDPAGLEAFADAGFHLLLVPRERGGLWESTARSTRPLAEALALIGGADSSLGLILSMEPFALFLTGWLADFDPVTVDPAWLAQRAAVFDRLRDAGDAWGVLLSELGGEVRSTATPSGDGYLMSGEKNWGSGWGGVGFLLTTAVPDGADTPDYFILDAARAIADGTATVTRAWDGHGMASSNSHAVRLSGAHVQRVAWPGRLELLKAMRANPTVAARLAPTAGIVRTAVETAGGKFAHKPPASRYEAVEWARAQAAGWLVDQALEGVLRVTAESTSAELFDQTSRLAKLGVTTQAEAAMLHLNHAVGASAYSRSSPFGWWLSDVRAVAHLMPPVSKAVEALAS